MERHELEFAISVERSVAGLRTFAGLAGAAVVATERASHLAWEWWIETPGWAVYAFIGVVLLRLLRDRDDVPLTADRFLRIRTWAVGADALFLLVQPVLHVSGSGEITLSPTLVFPLLIAARFAMRGAIAGTVGMAAALLATDQFSRRVNGWGLDPDGVVTVLLLALAAGVVGGALMRAAADGRVVADHEAQRALDAAARAERATATIEGMHKVLAAGLGAGVQDACVRMASTIRDVLDARSVTVTLRPGAVGLPAMNVSSRAPAGQGGQTARAPVHVAGEEVGELVVSSSQPLHDQEVQLLADQVGLAAQAAAILDQEAGLAGRYRDLDRLRADFLALAAHELRTPTTAIHGALATIEERGHLLGEDARGKLLDAAVRQTSRLIRLADDFITMGRSDAGDIPLRRDAVELGQLMMAALDVLPPDGAIHLQPGEACTVLVDATRAEQVLANLLENARTHGQAPVDVTWSVVDDHVAVRVADRGTIPEQDRQRVFDRFYVGDVDSHTRGSGLGLPISRDLARAMGGDLMLSDDPAMTEFVLTLPLAPSVARAPTGV